MAVSNLKPGDVSSSTHTAAAPFDGTFADPATAGTADLDELLPYPEVLRVRVVAGRRRDAEKLVKSNRARVESLAGTAKERVSTIA